MYKLLQGDGLFDYLLIFLGLRARVVQRKTTRRTLKGFLQRRTVSKRDIDVENVRQPRTLVREVYRKIYDRDLSPERMLEEPYISNSDDDNENRTRNINIRMKTSSSYGFLSWLYTSFIFLSLSVQPIYTLYYIFNELESNHNFYWSSFFFNIIPVVQYLFSIIYFGRSHFDDFYISRNDNLYGMNLYLFLILFGVLSMNIFSNMIIYGVGYFSTNDTEFPGFVDYPNSILITLFLNIVWVYSRLIIYTNLTVFTLVFYKHCRILSNYVKKIDIDKSNDIIPLNNITQDVLFIRRELEESIDYLKNIFSSFTLLGAIGFGFFIERIKNGNFDFFPWNQFIVYIVIQIVFIYVVLKVSNTKDDLSDYIRQPLFIERFLKRYNQVEINDKFHDNVNILILNTEEENASTLDWIVLNNLFNEEWVEFKVMGIDMSDGGLIKKGLVIVSIIVGMNSILS